MSAPAEIVDRIKKLLRLARSANPHEAQNALARAMALAREHAVAIDGLNADDAAKEKATTHRETAVEAALSYEKRFAFAVCRGFFNVDTITIHTVRTNRAGWPRKGVKTAIIGTKSDIEIALYVSAFLVRHFAYSWDKHRGRFRNRYAFVDGMYRGLVTKLWHERAEMPQATGSELAVNARAGYAAAVYGEVTTRKAREVDHDASAAARAGFQHGLNTQISTALQPAANETLALK